MPQHTVSNLDSLFTDNQNTAETMDKPTLELIQSLLSPPKQASSSGSRSHDNHLGTRATSNKEDSIFFQFPLGPCEQGTRRQKTGNA